MIFIVLIPAVSTFAAMLVRAWNDYVCVMNKATMGVTLPAARCHVVLTVPHFFQIEIISAIVFYSRVHLQNLESSQSSI